MIVSDWEAHAISHEIVVVTIKDNVDISDLTISVLNENRSHLVKMKVPSRHFEIHVDITGPSFAQLGDSVQYIKNSEL